MSSVSAVNSLVSGTTVTTPSVNISSILAATAGASTPGIDVNSAVASAIFADRAPERLWQSDQTTLSSQTTALTSIQTATSAITTDLQSLNTLTGPLSARIVTSTSSEISATAATGTVAGTHTIVVNNLARTASWYSDLAASPTATVPASSLTLTSAAGVATTFPTGSGTAGETLNNLASSINAANLGIKASVVSDSTGSRLALIATTSGAAADFSITSPNFSGTSWSSPDIPKGDTLGANTLTLTIAGTSTNISTTAGETYAQLATSINSMGLGVTATAGSDTHGTNLSIASTDGTTPFTINEPSFGFTQATSGVDASLTVDGVPIQSASNTVTGAIAGVTFSLAAASPAPVTLTVASDAGQVSTAINKFVSDYNTAIGLVNQQFTIGATGAQGVLGTDTTLVNLQSSLEQALNFVSTPAAGTTTTVGSLNDLGIKMGTDGTLSVNTATLDSALTNNPSDVQNFFEGAALNGFANSMTNALASYTDPAHGAFHVDLAGISATNGALTIQINNFERTYIATQQKNLLAEFSSAEAALQQLPAKLAQLQAELGNNGSKN